MKLPLPTTAYQAEAANLRRLLRRGRVDHASLQRRIAPCRLEQCHGMCCHAGVGLSRSEKRVIEALVRDHPALFAELGIALPAQVIEPIPVFWLFKVYKTATRPFGYRALVPDWPAHFPETACVFMRDDGACAFQLVSERLGRHPWHYKPVSCWLQPLKVGRRGGISLYLPIEETDRSRSELYPGYVLFTHCGRTRAQGRAAAAVLQDEIDFLAAITGTPLKIPPEGERP